MMHKTTILLITLVLILSSCDQATPLATPTSRATGILTPYHTLTPSPIVPTATIMVVIPVTPAPTPTPFTHKVIKGETMLGIAFQYGVSLDDVKAANPTVDPQFLSVGTNLVIPIRGEIPEIIPTPTPAQVSVDQSRCYRSGEGGAWCIVAVLNELKTGVENISVWIGLFTKQGVNISNETVYAALNLLKPGDTIPLMIYFKPPIPEEIQSQSRLLSALEVVEDDPRYLKSQADIDQVVISQDGSQAEVSGEVNLGNNNSLPSQVWALAVAYDANGNIIGSRKWESAGETQFAITVYSLAGAIDHVMVLTEARP
jgi:LysM repeat protein